MIKLEGTDILVPKYKYEAKQPGGGPMFWIHNPSEKEREVMGRIMRDQYMDSESYQLKSATGAFFQVGHSGNGSIGIEFWVDNKEAIDAFVFHFFELLHSAE